MSFDLMAWAVKQKCETAGQKLVLLMLASHTNGHTCRCDPSHKRLAEECCMGVSTLKRNIASLADAGCLIIEARSMDGVSLPNQYRLTPLNLDGVGPNRTDPQPNSGGGVGPNRATKQEVKTGIETKKKKKEGVKLENPISFNGTGFENLLASQLITWAAAYPAINVSAEILKAAAWLDANPANKKSDYKRFLNGWLTRSQDKAPAAGNVRHINRVPVETFKERDARHEREAWERETGRIWPANEIPGDARPRIDSKDLIDVFEVKEVRRLS